MKIVLPVHHFPPTYNSGAELYTFRLARWLKNHGHQVEVVCIESITRGQANELTAVFDTYEDVPVWRLSYNYTLAPDTELWSYYNPLLYDWFRKYLAEFEPDLVHFQGGYLIGVAPLEAVQAAGIPNVLTLHDYWFICPRITLRRGDDSLCSTVPNDPVDCAWCMGLAGRRQRLPDELTYGIYGKVMRRFSLENERKGISNRRVRLLQALTIPNKIIAPSQYLASRFAPFVDSSRVIFCRYGLDLEPLVEKQRPPDFHNLRIGFIGQIAPHKGIHLLIEAFKALRTEQRPIELHIYGSLEANPAYVKKLKRLAQADPRIFFHGRFENSRVAEILSGLEVTVVPSTWYENSPLAIMEAHAAGTPVITAALGGMAELVRDGVDGLHFAPLSSSDLARQLQRLIDEPNLLESLRSGVQKPRAIKDEMADLLNIYAEVASKKHSPGSMSPALIQG